jgi:AcrR family transcriptional regulator
MARASRAREKRRELLPILAQAFAELGYRRTTTAELAARCGVQENILYRLWPDKKAMFIAALGHVYDSSRAIWRQVLAASGDGQSAAQRLLEYEAQHHGEFGRYRLVFAGLSETDDPDIRAALADMYRQYQRFIARHIAAHRAAGGGRGRPDPGLAAWAVVGLGTVASLGRELGLVGARQRRRLLAAVGGLVLDGRGAAR